MLGSGKLRLYFAPMLAAALALGCSSERVDVDSVARPNWIKALDADGGPNLRGVLMGTENIRYFTGWYPFEFDAKTGGAWRWMGKKSITQLRTKPDNYPHAIDMQLDVYGWVPTEKVESLTHHLEFWVNGHYLGHYEPESSVPIHRTLFVPHQLLTRSDWVDFVITCSNTSRNGGDWRDLGFSTTGILWTPAPPGSR